MVEERKVSRAEAIAMLDSFAAEQLRVAVAATGVGRGGATSVGFSGVLRRREQPPEPVVYVANDHDGRCWLSIETERIRRCQVREDSGFPMLALRVRGLDIAITLVQDELSD